MEKMIDKTGPKFHFHQICHHPCFCPVINFPSSCKSTFRLVSNQLSINFLIAAALSEEKFDQNGLWKLKPVLWIDFLLHLSEHRIFLFVIIHTFNFWHSWICYEINFPAQFALKKSFWSLFSSPFWFFILFVFFSHYLLLTFLKSIWHSLLWKNLSDHLSLVHLSAHALFGGLFQSAVSHRKSICPFHTFLFDLSYLAYQISNIKYQVSVLL